MKKILYGIPFIICLSGTEIIRSMNTDDFLEQLTFRHSENSIKELLKNNGDVNKADGIFVTPLQFAAENLLTDLIAPLLKKGAKVNVATDPDGQTLLMLAAKKTLNEQDSKGTQDKIAYIIKGLLAYGANINAQDNAKKTALLHALDAGNLYIVRFLIESGANIELKDVTQNDALSYVLNTLNAPNITQNIQATYLFLLKLLIRHSSLGYLKTYPMGTFELLPKEQQEYITWLIGGADLTKISKEKISYYAESLICMPNISITNYVRLLQQLNSKELDTLLHNILVLHPKQLNEKMILTLANYLLNQLERTDAITFLKYAPQQPIQKDAETFLKKIQKDPIFKNDYLNLIEQLYAWAKFYKIKDLGAFIVNYMKALAGFSFGGPEEIIGSFTRTDGKTTKARPKQKPKVIKENIKKEQ